MANTHKRQWTKAPLKNGRKRQSTNLRHWFVLEVSKGKVCTDPSITFEVVAIETIFSPMASFQKCDFCNVSLSTHIEESLVFGCYGFQRVFLLFVWCFEGKSKIQKNVHHTSTCVKSYLLSLQNIWFAFLLMLYMFNAYV